MAINNNFYQTVNALMEASFGGTTPIVDYASFMDYGKTTGNLTTENIRNKFMPQLLNRIKMVLNNSVSYEGQLIDMMVSGSDVGAIIQTIMGVFYDATSNRALTELESGVSYTDQFEYSAPDKVVLYHVDTNGKEFTISIPDVRLDAAVESPEALDAFMTSVMTDVYNSINLAEEDERLAALADVIVTCLDQTENNTDETMGAMNVNLLKIYNDTFGTTLGFTDEDIAQGATVPSDPKQALSNDSFIRWATCVISDYSDLMAKVSTKFNKHGTDTTPFKTFTKKSDQRIKLNSIWKRAILQSRIDAFNANGISIAPEGVASEVLPYWQTTGDRMKVCVGSEGEGSEAVAVMSPDVLAVLYDKRRVMQVVEMKDTQSAYQPRRRYTSYFFQSASMLYSNEYCNAMVFTIKG